MARASWHTGGISYRLICRSATHGSPAANHRLPIGRRTLWADKEFLFGISVLLDKPQNPHT